jgi:tRNA(Ile)-lysidine synthetase-like protein
VGDSHERKIKLLFQETRIPLWYRRLWPVLTVDGDIVWCRRFGAAAAYAADVSTRKILRIRDDYPRDGCI